MAWHSVTSASKSVILHWLAALRVTAIAFVLALLVVPHFCFRASRRSSLIVKLFMTTASWIAGLRVRTTGSRLERNVLYASNHVSWLDIIALASSSRSAFVAMAEVKTIPLLGWLADQNNSVYVQRWNKSAIRSQVEALSDKLEHGHPITIFPEATTGPGDCLLPFRAPLFQAVLSRPGIRIQPVFLEYHEVANIAWIGDEGGVRNFIRLMGRLRRIDLVIHYLEPLPESTNKDRKQIAATCGEIIAKRIAETRR